MLAEPLHRRFGVEHGFLGGEGLAGDDEQRRRRIEILDRLFQRHAVDVGHDRDVVALVFAPQRIDQQVRPQRRSADADVEDVADVAQRARLDRVDQRAHPLVEAAGAGDAVRITLAAFGGVLDRAILGDIDVLAAEHRVALAGKVLGLGQRFERRDRVARQMRLRPVEMDAGDVQAERLQPVAVLGEQVHQLGGGQGFDRRPVAHMSVLHGEGKVVTVPYRSCAGRQARFRRHRNDW